MGQQFQNIGTCSSMYACVCVYAYIYLSSPWPKNAKDKEGKYSLRETRVSYEKIIMSLKTKEKPKM